MTSACEHLHPLVGGRVDNSLTTRVRNDRIGFPPHAAAAATTVRLRQRRRTLPESSTCGRQACSRQVATDVDNFALRELPALAFSQ